MRKRVLIIIAIFLITISLPVFADTGFDGADFEKYINNELQRWKVPGCAIVIVKDGRTILSRGYGYKDLENKEKVTPDTLFAIGSASKAFTAFALELLVDENKVVLDKPVREYYPGFMMYDKYVTEHITPRDLLTHRCGVSRYDMAWFLNDWTREQVLDKIRYLKPNYGFREYFQYNNYMFVAAGRIVELASNTSWEKFIEEKIFIPLQMKNSNFSVIDSQKSSDFAFPYKYDTKNLKEIPEDYSKINAVKVGFEEISKVGPAGSINSNIKDMEKWLRLQLDMGKTGGKQLISKKRMIEMHSPQMVIISPEPEEPKFNEIGHMNYGLGWFIMNYRGHRIIHHGGNIEGFSAMVSFMPEKNMGMVILTNMNETPLNLIFIFNIFDRLLGIDQLPWSDRIWAQNIKKLEKLRNARLESEKQRVRGTKPAHPLKDYAGKYYNEIYGNLEILKQEEQLVFEYTRFSLPLKHYNYEVFQIKPDDPISGIDSFITFNTNTTGKIESLKTNLEDDDRPVVFKKIE